MSIIVGFFISNNLKERLTYKDFYSIKMDSSIVARIEAFKEGIKLWKEKPICGTGLGSFVSHDEKNQLRVMLKYPHNIFIETLAETGLVGFFLLILLLIRGFIQTYNTSPFNFSLFIFLTIFSLTSKDITVNFIILLFPLLNSSTSCMLKNNI